MKVASVLRRTAYAESLSAFRNLLAAAHDTNHLSHKICALHAIGMVLILQQRKAEGLGYLRRALKTARVAADTDWVVMCLIDAARVVVEGRPIGFDLPRLRRASVAEQRRGNWASAAKLWEIYAHNSAEAKGSATVVEDAFVSARNCLERAAGRKAELIPLLGRFYAWLWNAGRHQQALATLELLQSVGLTLGDRQTAIRAEDQRGVCLQQLDRYDEAARLHLHAARVALRLGDRIQRSGSLNNLGEALRKLKRFPEAVAALQEAETTAIAEGDQEGAVTAAGNKALLLIEMGDLSAAERVLRRSRDRASRHKLWTQYVTILGRLADLSWERGRLAVAEERYRIAIREARERRQMTVLPGIALNFSRVLLLRGRAQVAPRELKRHEASFSGTRDKYLFHYTLGEIYQEIGDNASAERHLNASRSSAEAAGDSDYVAICCSRLAEIHEARKNFRLSERDLRVALLREPDPELRAILLIQLLRVQLVARSPRRAEKTFAEARDIAVRNNLHVVYLEIHLMISDHYWRGSRASKLNAMKGYAVALLKSVEAGAEAYGDVFGHILLYLIKPQVAPSHALLLSLIGELEAWLLKEVPGSPDPFGF